MKRVSALLILSFATVSSAFSEGVAGRPALDYETAHLSRVATAVRTTERITLDGRLDEPAWQLALPATDFIQQVPRPGEPSRERTEVRFLYDNDNLYVAFLCFDSDPAHMTISGLQQDFNFNESDSITLILDTLHDRQSGFAFLTHPAGALRDQQLSNNGVSNSDWDGVWDVKTSRNDDGWIAECMIPFTTLRFSTSSSQEWGLNIARRVLRINEISQWAPVPPGTVSEGAATPGHNCYNLSETFMSIKAAYENGVFKPLDNVKGATPGKIYTVFSQDELRDLCETLGWLKAAETSFEFWNNEEDAVYDSL